VLRVISSSGFGEWVDIAGGEVWGCRQTSWIEKKIAIDFPYKSRV
jgi:Zn-finger protein